MAAPRKKQANALPDSDQTLITLIPTLQELAVWWHDRKATLAHASDATQETERTTFHVERRWVEAIRRQADLDHLTITQVVNEAFKQYFTRCGIVILLLLSLLAPQAQAQAAPPRPDQVEAPLPGHVFGQSWSVEQPTRVFLYLTWEGGQYSFVTQDGVFRGPCRLEPGGHLRLMSTGDLELFAEYTRPRDRLEEAPQPGWPWCPGESIVRVSRMMFADRPHPQLYDTASNPRRPFLQLLDPKITNPKGR